eukprot:108013_1
MSCFACSIFSGTNSQLSQDDHKFKAMEDQAKKLNQASLGITVLLLGTSNSGKTTILKQIKRMNNKYNVENLNKRRQITTHIQSAVIEYMQILCEQSHHLSTQYDFNTSIDQKRVYLSQEVLALKPPFILTPEIAFKIHHLWLDKGIRETLKKRSYFQIDENVDHFLGKVQSISDDAYLPDFEDYLRFAEKSVGFSQTIVNLYGDSYRSHPFEFIDVKGNRAERRKWTKFIGDNVDVHLVLYVLPIADYDLTLFEDDETNCLVESIEVFHDVMVKGHFFEEQRLVVLFNKIDIFERKIRKIPITAAFDDFPSSKNANDAADVLPFIAGKLYEVFEKQHYKPKEPLRIIRTDATDKEKIEEIVFDISSDLIQRNIDVEHDS